MSCCAGVGDANTEEPIPVVKPNEVHKVIEVQPTSPPKRYTAKDLTLTSLTTGTHTLTFPQTVPFSIETCSNVSISLPTPLAQCTVDDVDNSTILLGPCEGAIFLRNLKDCVVLVSARQLRLRDCQRVKIGLFCGTDPVIETSSQITISCLSVSYPGYIGNMCWLTSEQMGTVGLDLFENRWDRVYDFNDTQGKNFVISEVAVVMDGFQGDNGTIPKTVPISSLSHTSTYTLILSTLPQAATIVYLQTLKTLLCSRKSAKASRLNSLFPGVTVEVAIFALCDGVVGESEGIVCKSVRLDECRFLFE